MANGIFSSSDIFTKHVIDRPIPVEALIKCKMQDNLEFLQWTKRYWDQYYPGHDYDPLARRKGAGSLPNTGAPTPRAAPAASTARRAAPASNTAAPRTRTPQGGAASAALREENNVLKETVSGLERERDFYFSKLRDIELLIQQAMDADPELEKDEGGLLKQIQTILYSTEVGCLSPNSPFMPKDALGMCLVIVHTSGEILTGYYRRDLRFPSRPKATFLRKRHSRGFRVLHSAGVQMFHRFLYHRASSG
jgi:hypothetical protein